MTRKENAERKTHYSSTHMMTTLCGLLPLCMKRVVPLDEMPTCVNCQRLLLLSRNGKAPGFRYKKKKPLLEDPSIVTI